MAIRSRSSAVAVAALLATGLAVTPTAARAWWDGGGWRGGYGWAPRERPAYAWRDYGRAYWPAPPYGRPPGYGWAAYGWAPPPAWGGYWQPTPNCCAAPAPAPWQAPPEPSAPPPPHPVQHAVIHPRHVAEAPRHTPVVRVSKPVGNDSQAVPPGLYHPPPD